MANKHIRNTQFIQVKNNDWRTKVVAIKNKTVRTLSNGTVIPTQLAMYRKAAKI
jgi:hypothetical protein